MPTLPALLLGFTLGSPLPDEPGVAQPVHGVTRHSSVAGGGGTATGQNVT